MQEKCPNGADFLQNPQPKREQEPTQCLSVEKKANPRPGEQKEQKCSFAHIEGEKIAAKEGKNRPQSVCQTAAFGKTAPQPTEKVVQNPQSHAQEDAPKKLRSLPSYGYCHT